MSTGKRLAKRSIIGTRVCALGSDGLYYAGVIQNVKTPHSGSSASPSFIMKPPSDPAVPSSTLYTVRFDVKRSTVGPGGVVIHHPGVPQNREFRDSDLIGPGFRNILDCSLKRGQKIFVTHNGRECNAEVSEHDIVRDEVTIKIVAHGQELALELKKRLEEVRLLESRRSARLADQERDTNFAQLADMAGDRRRPSHSIDVPFAFTQNGSRKRRPSYSQDDREFMFAEDSGSMDDCNAALILLKLSCSPHSPQLRPWKSYSSSPGSSSASWSSGSSSPPLSDDNNNNIMNNNNNRNRTASLSTSDEGIVMDLMPKKMYKCTWKGCAHIFVSESETVTHIRNAHLGPKKPRQTAEDSDGTFSDSDNEEDFYYEEIEEEPIPTSPPTLSHRDMARPPHEDPEYQMQIVMAHQSQYNNTIKPPLPIGSSPYSSSWSSHKNQKHVRVSPRPSSSYSPYPQGMSHGLAQAQHNINTYLGTPSSGPAPNSPSAMQFIPSLPHHFNTTITSSISPAAVSPSSSTSSSGGSSIQLSPHIIHHSSTHKHGKIGSLHGLSSKHGLGIYNHHHHSSPKSSPGGSGPNRSPLSPNRRTRGENKKCRKIYGMDQKASWCTQCKWKKACTRFSD